MIACGILCIVRFHSTRNRTCIFQGPGVQRRRVFVVNVFVFLKLNCLVLSAPQTKSDDGQETIHSHTLPQIPLQQSKTAFFVFNSRAKSTTNTRQLPRPWLNPNKPNRFSNPYQMGESTFIFKGLGSNLSFLFHFSMKIKIANRIAPDGTTPGGYSVCICPIKRPPGLYGLKEWDDMIFLAIVAFYLSIYLYNVYIVQCL